MADEGAVTVCVRVRPLIARESAGQDKVSLQWRSENNTISEVNGTKVFSYDRVFHSCDNTQQLYEGVAVPIIQSAVQGYNGTIFAYGQTASGKTYTMMGNEDSVGIIPKAIEHIFKVICEIPDREFLLRVSYMEIYNETITDLLCDTRKKKPLGIREDVNRNTYVEDLIEEVVVAPDQVMEWIRKGEKNRHYGETKMNEHSSRSHTIFRMIIESRERSDPANANCDGAVMVSHLNLVDLAGSERASQTGSEGVRLKEGCNINRSLFILGQVIKKLCDDPSGFINYRDSKLTRILQNSLGGNAKTVIICTITPVSFDETLSTLQFANIAKRMKNTPKVNEVLDEDALLKRYRKEILDLKKQLEEVSSKTQINAVEKDQLAQLLEEKNSLQKVQEEKIRNLTEMLVTSASFSSKQNAKAKRKRRVTWAPGEIDEANISFFEDFEEPRLTKIKKTKMSLSALPDVEDSMLGNSEHDNQFLMVPDPISDVEWTAGPNMNWTQKRLTFQQQLLKFLVPLQDIAVNEASVLQASVNNLVLENEQLKLEINEMKEKLKEKAELDEFEALEKQTQKDHEILEKCEEIRSLKLEREKLLSEIADNEIRLKHMTEEIGKSKDDLADAQLKYVKSDQEYVALKQLHEELEQKYVAVTENNQQMKFQIDILSKGAQESKTSLDEVKLELTGVTENLTRVSSEYDKLLAEKEQIERTLNENICHQLEQITILNKEKDELRQMVEACKAERDQLEADCWESKEKNLETEKELKWQQELLSNEKIKAEEREKHLLQVQRQLEIVKDSLTSKIQQLTEVHSISCEKDQLLAERTSHSFQLKEQISSINQEEDGLQKFLQGVRSEWDQLKTELQKNSECVEANAKLECALDQPKQRNLNDVSIQVNPLNNAEQIVEDSLKEKNLKIKELLEKFPNMEKRYECLSTVSLNLKSELNSQKALIAVMLTEFSSEQSKEVKRLQTVTEKINSHLQSLLNKLQFLFSRVCSKKREYHTTVNKYEMELLEEKRKQDQLQAQMQCLRKTYLNRDEISSKELNIHEVLQSLHLDAENIDKDLSEMESELLSIEAEMQQEESARKERAQFWEACSGTRCDIEELKEQLTKDNERLLQVINFWTPKVKILLQLSSELGARTASYCKNADVELKQRKEKSEEMLQELNTLKEQLASGGSASLALEEENYRLRNKLMAAEQDIKAMEMKIQMLKNEINEVEKNVKEKDDSISMLHTQLRIKTETSELTQLQAKLNETEECLKTTLTENQSLQAKLNKGAELYKEEIDHLKTQLVKCDMERMKQSNIFDTELANYKALVEHQEQQLRKLKEEFRRVQQEQDVTVVLEKEAPQQSQTLLTCGGGSGIVQSTQILVLKSEQVKLQKENLHLRKQHDLLLSNELQLKEELIKWKERALKWREELRSRETTGETLPRSPRKKKVSYFLKEQMPSSPCKELISQEIVTQEVSEHLPLTLPTNLFDSSLGTPKDTQPMGTEPTEEHLGTSEKDKAPDCTTQ
ncbi:centromere-associated protein E [Aegotheles albertisi]